jgi:hypothetical protein
MLTLNSRTLAHGHDRSRHNCNGTLDALFHGDNIGLTYAEGSTGTNYSRPRYEQLARGGRQEVDLEFNSEHSSVVRHETEGGITTRAVGDRSDGTCVREPMLLRHTLVDRHLDVYLAWLDAHQPRSKGGHQPLSFEAVANTLFN